MKFKIPDAARDRHVYVPGMSGSGKTTLLHWMVRQDILDGKGVCVLDPNSDFVEAMLDYVPEKRVEDCIYLDVENPVPIDFMSWEGERERQTLMGDLMQTFMSFVTMTAGDQWQSILRWTLLTLLEAKGCCFLDVAYFLQYEWRREEILARITNPKILHYWEHEFTKLKAPREDPILSRMSPFTTIHAVEVLLGNPKATLNLFDVMQEKKILLVNLGSLGKMVGDIVGKLLVSKIRQAAFRRKPHERVPFHLYADEFQDFQTSEFDTILSQGRKYKLCLTLAHQYVDQLDPRIRSAIFGNVGSMIVFQLDDKDAPIFKGRLGEDEWGSERHKNLINLETGQAYYWRSGGRVTLIKTFRPPDPSKASYAETIKKRTVDKYASEATPDMFQLKNDEHIAPSTGQIKGIPSHGGKAKGHKAPG